MAGNDDVIRLDLTLNTAEAQKNAQAFINKLESDFKKAQQELNTALSSGVGGAANSKQIQQLTTEVKKAEGELKKFKSVANDVSTNSGKLANSLSSVSSAFAKISTIAAAVGITSIGAAFGKLALDAVRATGTLEQTELALRSLTARELVNTGQFDSIAEAFENSEERAQELIQTLFELARTSPFSRQQILDAFRLAQAYGFTGDEALRLTQATVDLAAGTGQSAEAISRIALAFGQIKARGSLAGQELRQLQEAGFAAGDVLRDLGFSLDDVSKGLVDADIFLEAAARRIETDFGGAAARATNTIQGLSSTIADLRTDALIAFFRPAIEAIQPQIAEFAASFQEASPSIKEAGQAFGEFVSTLLADAPKAIEVVNGIATAFEGLATIISTVQKIQQTEILGVSVKDISGGTRDFFTDPLGTLQGLGQIGEQAGISDFFSGVAESVGDFPIVQQAFDNLKTSVDALSFGAETLNNAQKLLADGFSGTTEELIKLAEQQAFNAREEERLAEISTEAANRQGELQDKIAQTTIVRERAAQVAQEAADAEAKATEEQAEAQRKLIVSLVESSKEADKNAIAIFKQAEAAGASSAQLEDLALSLGILTPAQIEAKIENDLLIKSFIDGGGEAPEYGARLLELQSIIDGTGSTAASAASRVNILTDAFKKATSPTRRRGGGGRDNSLKEEVDELERQAKAIEDSTKNFADLVLEIAEADAKLAEAREELNKAINEGASEDDLEKLREKIAELEQGTEDWESSLFRLTQEAGASIETLAQLGVATGQFTQEQADAAIAAINRERGLRAIAKALAEQSINTEDATAAAEELNRQLAEGEDVDLTAFGIDVSQVDTEAVPALLRESAQAAREAAEALTKIAGALSGVADENESLAQAILNETAAQALQEAKTLDEKKAALELALAFGTLNKEQANNLAQLALLQELQQSYNDKTGEAVLTSGQYAEVLRLVADEGFTVEEALNQIGVSLDEIPEDLRIDISTNKDEVLSDINEINQQLNELERDRVVRLQVQREEITVQTGGTGAGSVPVPEDATFDGASGGFTGKGNPNQVAGIVHKEELVIPQNVLRGGVPAIANFAANNVPNFRNSVSLANPSPVQNAAVPSVTTINNTTTAGDTITTTNSNRGGDTIILNGEQAGRVARSIFNTQDNVRQNNLMKRNGKLNALWAS